MDAVKTDNLQELQNLKNIESYAREIISFFSKKGTAISGLENINTFAQETFLRPTSKRRRSGKNIDHYETLLSNLSDSQKKKLLSIFKQSGVFQPLSPKIKDPDIVFIMGTLFPTMHEQASFLYTRIEEGKLQLSKKTKFIFLTGDRSLSDEEKKFSSHPPYLKGASKEKALTVENETELGELIWEHVLSKSSLIRNVVPTFIKAKGIEDARRATTADTIRDYLSSHKIEQDASILMISANPFLFYQELVARTCFIEKDIKNYTLESAGITLYNPNLPISMMLGILLDNFARTIYQLLELKRLGGTAPYFKKDF